MNIWVSLMTALSKMVKSASGKLNLMSTLIGVVLLSALLPTIRGFVVNVQANGSATEAVMYGLLTMFIAIAFIYGVIKESGLQSAKV